MTRIVQVSDTHLSPTVPYADANWEVVLDYVQRTGPDLVVHSGDITYNGADLLDNLTYAKVQLDRLSVPWRAVPGNHDIGDFGDTDQPVNPERRARYESIFGAGSWSTQISGWRLVGLDVQTLLSDVDDADELWSWFETELAQPEMTVLFMHRPLMPLSETEVDDPHRFVGEPARTRIRDLLAASNVQLVATGHIHQWRPGLAASVPAQVWAPTTWAVLPESIQPTMGAKVLGVVEHRLDASGVTSELVVPEGMAQVTSGRDFHSPYPL